MTEVDVTGEVTERRIYVIYLGSLKGLWQIRATERGVGINI